MSEPLEAVLKRRFSGFQDDLGRDHWSSRLRQQAWSKFESEGFPGKKHARWRTFDHWALTRAQSVGSHVALSDSELATILSPVKGGAPCLVFVNGTFQMAHSVQPRLPGVTMRRWDEMRHHDPEIERMLDWQAGGSPCDSLVALNTALFREGVALNVESGAMPNPFLVVFVHTPHSLNHPRVRLRARSGSTCHLVEVHLQAGAGWSWTNSLCDVEVHEDANVRHTLLLEGADQGVHLNQARIKVGSGAQYQALRVLAGTSASRSDVSVDLQGEHGRGDLKALSLGYGSAVLDSSVWMQHSAPKTTSRQLIKSVLFHTARAAFHGRIRVQKDAQKIDAQQTCRNLLLSDQARAVANPELEIFADDVRCTHGATTGHLDRDALFYLQSRGMARGDAERVLIRAFIGEVLAGHQDLDAMRWIQETTSRVEELISHPLQGSRHVS